MAIQGNGKVRLIAKNGRYRETAYTGRIRNLMETFRSPIWDSTGMSAEDRKAAQEMIDGRAKAVFVNRLRNGEGLEDYFVEFEATPEITESGSVSYFEAGDIRGPGSILYYMGSPARTFTINAKLISRNRHEALVTDSKIHILKSWRMPESYTGGINAGPPTLLYLQGYGKMFKDIPVVMTDLSIELSSEHDYMKTNPSEDGGTAVPIITPVSITLKEARSVEAQLEGLETFDILKYRTGNLAGW